MGESVYTGPSCELLAAFITTAAWRYSVARLHPMSRAHRNWSD